MLYGIMLILLGVERVQNTLDLRRLGVNKWYMEAIAAFISMIGGTIIISNPFATAETLWMFTGVALIVDAIADVLSYSLNEKTE